MLGRPSPHPATLHPPPAAVPACMATSFPQGWPEGCPAAAGVWLVWVDTGSAAWAAAGTHVLCAGRGADTSSPLQDQGQAHATESTPTPPAARPPASTWWRTSAEGGTAQRGGHSPGSLPTPPAFKAGAEWTVHGLPFTYDAGGGGMVQEKVWCMGCAGHSHHPSTTTAAAPLATTCQHWQGHACPSPRSPRSHTCCTTSDCSVRHLRTLPLAAHTTLRLGKARMHARVGEQAEACLRPCMQRGWSVPVRHVAQPEHGRRAGRRRRGTHAHLRPSTATCSQLLGASSSAVRKERASPSSCPACAASWWMSGERVCVLACAIWSAPNSSTLPARTWPSGLTSSRISSLQRPVPLLPPMHHWMLLPLSFRVPTVLGDWLHKLDTRGMDARINLLFWQRTLSFFPSQELAPHLDW